MAVTDFFAGEIVTELLKTLLAISRKSCLSKGTADQLISSIEQLLPIIQEIKYSGVELPSTRQSQLDRFSEVLIQGKELACKVLAAPRWNVYRNLLLARKMEKLEKTVSRFVQGPLQSHILADVHHLRFETTQRFDRLDGSHQMLEQRLGALKIGTCSGAAGGVGGGWMEEAVRRVEEEGQMKWEISNSLVFGLGLGMKKVKDLILGRDELRVVGICGIGGSGKTTLARELCKDDQVRSYFSERILFLTVSQSPDLAQLKAKIVGFIMGNQVLSPNSVLPQLNLQYEWLNVTKTLVVLDDVWSLKELEPLLFKIPGCKILVVSRFKFPTTVVDAIYDVELLKEDEALSLFCHSAFGQNSIPPPTDKNLVKQIVNECKRLPLALKVIGASLRDQPERCWANARNKLAQGEAISESHENHLLQRMEISVNCLSPKVKDCFLDLGAFPEDKKIPLDVLTNMWVETHGIDEEEAFAILVELSDKNLLTLVKEARDGDIYSSSYDISVTQHDVLRDLALHLGSHGCVNERIRLLMPRREAEVPREWERYSDQPFYARIVSIHTGEMNEMDWFQMDFPKCEVLILNFASDTYLLPPFIANMPKLRALIIVNYSTSNAALHGFSILSNLPKLRSLWLEKVSVPRLSTIPLKNLRKISIILCKINQSLDQSAFPLLVELTIDHCDDLFILPSCLCEMQLLKTLSITNCHSLYQLPADLFKLTSLQILRLYACPALQTLPLGICELLNLKYIDISQCVNLSCLPISIGKLSSLEKIDMRECSQISGLPKSVTTLKSLRLVVCDEEMSWLWRDAEKALPELHVQVAEKRFDLDWLDE